MNAVRSAPCLLLSDGTERTALTFLRGVIATLLRDHAFNHTHRDPLPASLPALGLDLPADPNHAVWRVTLVGHAAQRLLALLPCFTGGLRACELTQSRDPLACVATALHKSAAPCELPQGRNPLKCTPENQAVTGVESDKKPSNFKSLQIVSVI